MTADMYVGRTAPTPWPTPYNRTAASGRSGLMGAGSSWATSISFTGRGSLSHRKTLSSPRSGMRVRANRRSSAPVGIRGVYVPTISLPIYSIDCRTGRPIIVTSDSQVDGVRSSHLLLGHQLDRCGLSARISRCHTEVVGANAVTVSPTPAVLAMMVAPSRLRGPLRVMIRTSSGVVFGKRAVTIQRTGNLGQHHAGDAPPSGWLGNAK